MTAVRTGGHRGRVVAVLAVAVSLALAGCSNARSGVNSRPSGGDSRPVPAASAPESSVAPVQPVSFHLPSGRRVNPAAPVTLTVAHGRLTSVTMTNPTGRKVAGAISGDARSWHTTEALGYAKRYAIVANGIDESGATVQKRSSLTTVTPRNMTMPDLQRIGGYPLTHGATYGVGIVPVVHFDEPVPNRAAAQRALSVASSPHVDGVWNWVDDQNVHFRPQHYWPAGTRITVTADVYGVDVGHGLYGQSDVSTSFTIGRRQVTVADDTAPRSVNKVKVYDGAGRLLRTMNTSMGQHGGVDVNGNWINFYTLDGTYTVLAHEQPARMCSASYGLPADVQGGYPCEDIYNATKISTDGIYLHELDSTVPEQNQGRDVSHGCLNLNQANARWYFAHSMVGDPVEIHGHPKAPELTIGQGGDWTVPWSAWVSGSAV
jgi:lipoprotein-anchoring transpeptidase ErfK/SrfK